MQLSEFRATLSVGKPPEELSDVLKAMWLDANGDWDRAHELAQSVDTADGSWVHAYLHRVEGDLGNAGYWYRRAGHEVHRGALSDEWEEIVSALLSSASA
jgi:hypothetical protein